MGDIEVARWNRVDFLVPKHLQKSKIGPLEQIWAKNPYVTFFLGHPVHTPQRLYIEHLGNLIWLISNGLTGWLPWSSDNERTSLVRWSGDLIIWWFGDHSWFMMNHETNHSWFIGDDCWWKQTRLVILVRAPGSLPIVLHSPNLFRIIREGCKHYFYGIRL